MKCVSALHYNASGIWWKTAKADVGKEKVDTVEDKKNAKKEKMIICRQKTEETKRRQ